MFLGVHLGVRWHKLQNLPSGRTHQFVSCRATDISWSASTGISAYALEERYDEFTTNTYDYKKNCSCSTQIFLAIAHRSLNLSHVTIYIHDSTDIHYLTTKTSLFQDREAPKKKAARNCLQKFKDAVKGFYRRWGLKHFVPLSAVILYNIFGALLFLVIERGHDSALVESSLQHYTETRFMMIKKMKGKGSQGG